MKILFFLIIYFCLQFGKWDNSNRSILVANGQGSDPHCIKKPAAPRNQASYTKTLKTNGNNISYHGASHDLKTSRLLASAFCENEFWYKFTRLSKCLVEKLLQKSENVRQAFFGYYYSMILVLILLPVFSKLPFTSFSTDEAKELDFKQDPIINSIEQDPIINSIVPIINSIAFVFLGRLLDIFVKNNKLAKSAKFNYIAANTLCWMLYTHPIASICFLFMTLFVNPATFRLNSMTLFVNPATFRLNSISYFTTIMLTVYHISAAVRPYYSLIFFGLSTFLILLTNSSLIDANSFVLILQKSAPDTQFKNIFNLPCLAILALIIHAFTALSRLQGLFTNISHIYLALLMNGLVTAWKN